MTRRLRPLRLVAAASLVAVAVVALPSSSVGDVDGGGRYPGLPFMACPDDPPASDYDPCLGTVDGLDKNGWINAVSVGRAGSPVAKQWAPIPLSVMGNNVAVGNRSLEGGGIANDYLIRTFFVSQKNADANYGISPPVRVRTVAFGSIPVELTLEVRQRRDAKDLPVPLELRYWDESQIPDPGGSRTTGHPAELVDDVDVRITDLSVDGIDIGLADSCGTQKGAHLELTSEEVTVIEEPGYVSPSGLGKFFDEFDPADGFYGFYGGTLEGTLDIPPFRRCGTKTGDDLSPLLTSALSAPGNPVTLTVGSLNCVEFNPDDFSLLPPAPGSNTPAEAGCLQEYYEPEGAVTNERVRTVPLPLSLTDHAPDGQPAD